jgi:hypothetical protein
MGSSISFDNALADFDKSNVDDERVFLSAYSKNELISSFDRFLLPKVQHLYPRDGFRFEIDVSDPFVHSASVSHRLLDGMRPDGQFLLKIFVRRYKLDPLSIRVLHPTNRNACFDQWCKDMHQDLNQVKESMMGLPRDLDASGVEFLFMQNPLAQFTERRPQLPGQNFPGLGLGKEMLSLLANAGKKNHRDFLVENPAYIHNAIIYNRAGMRFLSPHCEAFFEILLEDLAVEIEHEFAKVAEACHAGKILFRGQKVKISF